MEDIRLREKCQLRVLYLHVRFEHIKASVAELPWYEINAYHILAGAILFKFQL